jgi:hypothetical protein
MDAWAMRKSWTHFATVGYEIKVSRSDFLNDKKWPDYLDYCNELYFVCPPDIIKANEVPENCGLLWCSKNQTMLYTKKKAPSRKAVKLENVFVYILMWRALITRDYCNSNGNISYWRNWLEEKNESKQIGNTVSRKLRELVANRIDKVERDNISLKDENEALSEVKKLLQELGITAGCWDVERKVRDQIENSKEALSPEFTTQLRNIIKVCSDILKP